MVVKNVSERRGSLESYSLGRSNAFLALSSLACSNVRSDVKKKKSCLIALVEREKGMEAGLENSNWLPASHHFLAAWLTIA